MSAPSDYLAIMYLQAAYPYTQHSLDLPDSYEGSHELLVDHFEKTFNPIYTRMAIDKLASWGLLEVINDHYAGDLIIHDRKDISDPRATLGHLGMSGLFNAAVNGGEGWMRRVLDNDEFWVNFAGESEQSGEKSSDEIEFKSEVPASDRVVRLDHNQVEQLNDPIQEIIELVEPENSIGSDPGLRELILGKLKAGRELVRAGIFSLQSLHLTLVVGLQMLVEKHKETAISVAATKLLDLLLAEFGIA